MKTKERLKVDIPILHFNLTRLQQCVDKVVAQRGLQEKMFDLEELAIALEFYLQIDGKSIISSKKYSFLNVSPVDMFFLKTCSFHGVQPRLIDRCSREGLFCYDIPEPRFAIMPCNQSHCHCCHSPCPRRYVTEFAIPFSIPHIHRFVNQYEAILNCPAVRIFSFSFRFDLPLIIRRIRHVKQAIVSMFCPVPVVNLILLVFQNYLLLKH